MSTRLVVGRVVKPHGIRGEVAVQPESENPTRFASGSSLHAGDRALRIRASRPHQGRILVFFDGVDDRNAAELLRGAELTIEATDAMDLPDGSYYPHELHGCVVVDQAGTELGTLIRVDESTANDLWVVATASGDVLVPAVRQIVLDVNLSARRIVVAPPEGMFG